MIILWTMIFVMTLKEKRNHYNVKFLKGYGHSISVKDSKIILKDCHDPFSPPFIEEWFPNRMPYEKIVLSGKERYLKSLTEIQLLLMVNQLDLL